MEVSTLKPTFQAVDPKTGQALPGEFTTATTEELEQTMRDATSAYLVYRKKSGAEKAAFLDEIGAQLMALGDELIHRVMAESGLPEGRVRGELGRTVNQLKSFARLIEEGSWCEASIDTALPDRQPVPKPDIRKVLTPIGPVVVFGASNFPLAFSTAGGDTASALAAGNPVVVKGHPSHPGTSALVAGAIQKAAEATGMPEGVFTLLQDAGIEIGKQLVLHPATKAVGFTGSYRGGKALLDLAATREEPIPVFAEMGSLNPVFILPEKLKQDRSLASTLVASFSLGTGQFCTKPGLIITVESPALSDFETALAETTRQQAVAPMLNEGIHRGFNSLKDNVVNHAFVTSIAEGAANDNAEGFYQAPATARVEGKNFLENPTLAIEVFGPFALVIVCSDQAEMQAVANSLEGQLTATIFGQEDELSNYPELIDTLSERAGRLIFNNVPTGVEVCPSMHHGGPFPATTDSRFTSVGTDAIKRFARPVCYQNWPQEALPQALKNGNPEGILRLFNNQWTRDKIDA